MTPQFPLSLERRREGPEEARGPPGLGLWGGRSRDRTEGKTGKLRWRGEERRRYREAETERHEER